MDPDVLTVVSAAAQRTMSGTAKVVVSCEMAVPEYEGAGSYAGVADFDRGRCRLDAVPAAPDGQDGKSMVFDGPMVYTRQPDGRWISTRCAPGAYSLFDPRWALAALMNAPSSATATGEDAIELALDPQALSTCTDIALASDWDAPAARVELSCSARIAQVKITLGDRDHLEAWMRLEYRISEPGSPCTIEVPAPEVTVSFEQHLEEQDDASRDGT